MLIYPEFDPSTYPQYRFVECDNYMTSRGLVKFNLDYAINTSTNWKWKDLERNGYLDAPFVKLENYTWFCCPLEFYAEKTQKDYYESYREEGDHELVSHEEFHILIKSHNPRMRPWTSKPWRIPYTH
jgi:hypothetical protein